ncbi:SDR family oxidoreductase [Corynebacterium flavescens]|nr:SDR family oxidoreductase [Corynebacterium flavescens]
MRENNMATGSAAGTASKNQKTWLITGATSGLGKTLALAALDSGESVVATARRPRGFAEMREAYGDRFTGIVHDVRDTEGAGGFVKQAIAALGRIDVLVNNAGAGQVGTAEEVTDGQLRDMLEQHLYGPAALVRAALPHMRAAGGGAIVQMSSQGGRTSFPAAGSYSAGKFALEGWSEALFGEVAPFGIRVLIVEPSRFRTEFNSAGVLNWAGKKVEYDGVVGAIRQDMAAPDGAQEGDPERAAEVIRRVLDLPEVPLRQPLGAEAVANLSRTYGENLAALEKMKEYSVAADFPGMKAAQRAFRQGATSVTPAEPT